SIEATMSASDTFVITSALLFGPAPATVALAVDSIVMSWRRGHGWTRLSFNAAAPALSLWVAARVFFLIARVPRLSDGHGTAGGDSAGCRGLSSDVACVVRAPRGRQPARHAGESPVPVHG